MINKDDHNIKENEMVFKTKEHKLTLPLKKVPKEYPLQGIFF